MKAVHLSIVVGLIGGLFLPGQVQAEGRPTQLADHAPDAKPVTLELDLGWHTDEMLGTTVHVLSPTLSGRIALADTLELELEWPMVFLDASDAVDDSTFLSGNPFAALYLVDRERDGYFRIGAGVALPLSDLDVGAGRLFGVGGDPDIDRLAYAYARVIRGLWDAWLYYPNQLAIVVPAQIEGRRGALVIGADGAGALLIPTDDAVDDDSDFVLQGAGMLGLRAGPATLGARLQAVWSPTSHGDAQLAAVPFVQGDFDEGRFVYARLVLNLDDPLGVFGDGAEIWGLFVGGGGRF